MDEFDGIEQLAAAFIREGMPEDRAWEYASLIGDTFQLDNAGRLLVYRGANLIAPVPLPVAFRRHFTTL